MCNFTDSQKPTNLHFYATLVAMQTYCIKNHGDNEILKNTVTQALHGDRLCHRFDFKGFLFGDNGDTTASAGPVTQPPLPPLGGRGLSPTSRHLIYSLNTHMQCRKTEKRPAAYLHFFATLDFAKRRRDDRCNKIALFARACARFGR